jgi:hypothetical protein
MHVLLLSINLYYNLKQDLEHTNVNKSPYLAPGCNLNHRIKIIGVCISDIKSLCQETDLHNLVTGFL